MMGRRLRRRAGVGGLRVWPSRSAGRWQSVAAVPAVAGSAVLVVLGCALLAPWPVLTCVPMVVWAGGGLGALTRPGERVAVALTCGFRRLQPDQMALLGGAWHRVLAAGVPADRVDFYVRPGGRVNGFAAGGHSVAVTLRTLEDFAARRHSQVVTEALLAHEVGHLTVPGARFSVAMWWLALPWRCAAGAVMRVCLLLGGAAHQPRQLLIPVVVAGTVLGTAQAADRGDWPAAASLTALAILTVSCPLLRAAAGRAAEYAADAFAASCGYGPALAWALEHTMRRPDPAGWAGRMLSDHPGRGPRLDALRELSARP